MYRCLRMMILMMILMMMMKAGVGPSPLPDDDPICSPD